MKKYLAILLFTAATSASASFVPGPFQISQPTILGATVTFNGAQPVTLTQPTVIGATVTYNGTQVVAITQPTILGATVTFNGTQNVSVVNNSTVSVVNSTVPVVGAIIPPVTGIINSATSIIASTFTPVYNNAAFTIWPGTATGVVVTFEASADSGTSWQSINATQDNNNILGNTFTVATATTSWDSEIAGMTNFRVRATGWTTGFSSVTIVIGALPTIPNLNVTGSTVAAIQSGVFQVEPGTNPFKAVVTGSTVTITQSQPFQVEPGTNVFRISGTVAQGLAGTSRWGIDTTTGLYVNGGVAQGTAMIGNPLPQGLVVSSATLPTARANASAIYWAGSTIGQGYVTGTPEEVIFSSYAVSMSTAQTGIGGLTGESVLVSSAASNLFTYLCGCEFTNTTATNVAVTLESPAGTVASRMTIGAPANYAPAGIWPGCMNPFYRSAPASNIYIYQSGAAAAAIYMRCQYYQGP